MKLKILLEKQNIKLLAVIFVSTTILFLACMASFLPLLAQFPLGAGLYDMKDAYTKERMDAIVQIWESDDMGLDYWVSLMWWVHFLDGFFMTDYGIMTFTGLLLVARLLESRAKLQDFYFYLAFISLLAPLFDVVEQINILIMLGDPTNINGINVFWASLSTDICVAILYPCIGLMIFGVIVVIIERIKSK